MRCTRRRHSACSLRRGSCRTTLARSRIADREPCDLRRSRRRTPRRVSVRLGGYAASTRAPQRRRPDSSGAAAAARGCRPCEFAEPRPRGSACRLVEALGAIASTSSKPRASRGARSRDLRMLIASMARSRLAALRRRGDSWVNGGNGVIRCRSSVSRRRDSREAGGAASALPIAIVGGADRQYIAATTKSSRPKWFEVTTSRDRRSRTQDRRRSEPSGSGRLEERDCVPSATDPEARSGREARPAAAPPTDISQPSSRPQPGGRWRRSGRSCPGRRRRGCEAERSVSLARQ